MADKMIDERLLDADCTEKIEENFNRVLDLIDEGGGSGGIMYVTISEEEVDDTVVYTADKTFAEIAAAAEAGKDVRAIYELGGGIYYMTAFTNTSEQKMAEWAGTCVYPDEENANKAWITGQNITIVNDGTSDAVYVYEVEGQIELISGEESDSTT